jgi:hypothetical protein
MAFARGLNDSPLTPTINSSMFLQKKNRFALI